MNAKELLKSILIGGIEIEQSGIATGSSIVEAGLSRYFGAMSSGIGVSSDKDYLYYYGCLDKQPCSMPSPSMCIPIDDVDCVYLWEID